jgi:hypothetical protein
MIDAQRLAPIVFVTAALAASACSFGPPPTRADLAAQSACRERADEVFQRQNRDQVYRVDAYRTDTRDAPFATSGLKGVTSAGLGQQFSRDTMLDNCLRGTGAAPLAPPMSRDLQTTGPTTGP